MPRALLLLLILASPIALAQVRCELPGGKVLYTDEPCPAGAKVRPVSAAPQPSAAEVNAASVDSQFLQMRGQLAGDRAAQRIEEDQERARVQRQYEREAAARAAEIDAQRRQADALERIARDSAAKPIYRRGRCRVGNLNCR